MYVLKVFMIPVAHFGRKMTQNSLKYANQVRFSSFSCALYAETFPYSTIAHNLLKYKMQIGLKDRKAMGCNDLRTNLSAEKFCFFC